jgi:hypothetical protein
MRSRGGMILHDVHGQWKEQPKLTSHAVIGTLKGYDQLMNLVLDEVKEALTGMHCELFPLAMLTRCRRRRQHPLSQTWSHCRARHAPCSHLARRRQRRDPESFHTRGTVRREHQRGLYGRRKDRFEPATKRRVEWFRHVKKDTNTQHDTHETCETQSRTEGTITKSTSERCIDFLDKVENLHQ